MPFYAIFFYSYYFPAKYFFLSLDVGHGFDDTAGTIVLQRILFHRHLFFFSQAQEMLHHDTLFDVPAQQNLPRHSAQ